MDLIFPTKTMAALWISSNIRTGIRFPTSGELMNMSLRSSSRKYGWKYPA